MAFNRQVLRLRASGTVSVGHGGKRYRGGRAYVAIAVDDHGIVRDAISLRGFARPPAPRRPCSTSRSTRSAVNATSPSFPGSSARPPVRRRSC